MPSVNPASASSVRWSRENRDRVRLDNQLGGQPPGLVGRGMRGRLIRVSDGDQVSHNGPFPER
jgi:hypothetical protein